MTRDTWAMSADDYSGGSDAPESEANARKREAAARQMLCDMARQGRGTEAHRIAGEMLRAAGSSWVVARLELRELANRREVETGVVDRVDALLGAAGVPVEAQQGIDGTWVGVWT